MKEKFVPDLNMPDAKILNINKN